MGYRFLNGQRERATAPHNITQDERRQLDKHCQKIMKNLFVSYTKHDIKQYGDNVQNITFELMTRCISEGVRIIIEQNAKRGSKYLMVDFSPTDNSNSEFEYDGEHVCIVTSIDGDSEGSIYENFSNYLDACRWLSDFLLNGSYQELYIETY